jgi:aldose 1-epimerase
MRLETAEFSLDLAPEEGGLVLNLEWRESGGRVHPLLKPAPAGGWDRAAPRRFGLWPMVPFANRAFGAVVDDGECRYSLPVNDPAMGATIHGFGWQSAWEVVESAEGYALMRHERRGAEDPYAYRAEFAVWLETDSARFDISVQNLAGLALPFGLGLHPWFPAAADTRLTMAAAGELEFGEGYRASGLRRFVDGGPFAAGAFALRGETLAHSILDWDGAAEIHTPSRGLALGIAASSSLRQPVLWTPAGADFLCLEPQSHALGAPSEAAARTATPLVRLEKGQSLSGWMSLRPRALAAG